MLLWFVDLMNVTEEVTIHRPNVLTLLSTAFIRGDLNAAYMVHLELEKWGATNIFMFINTLYNMWLTS